jgi:hypothetical protein
MPFLSYYSSDVINASESSNSSDVSSCSNEEYKNESRRRAQRKYMQKKREDPEFKEKRRGYTETYNNKHRERINAVSKESQMYKYNNFPEFKIKVNSRRRINYYIKTRNITETEAIEYIRSIDKVKNNEPN